MIMGVPSKKVKNFSYVLITGFLTFCTFYWYILPSTKHHGSNIIFEGSMDIWRWDCNKTSNTCNRLPWKFNEPGQSLRTCQMSCGFIPIWPLPNGEVIMSNKSSTFSYKNVKIMPIVASNHDVKKILSSACQIFLDDIKPNLPFNSNVYQADKKYFYISVNVVGNTSDVNYRLGIDESYKLIVNDNTNFINVSIKSLTFFGARHALETLRQLIWYDEINDVMKIISTVKIYDSPSFTYRGLLLDTANHFISIKAIKRTIKAMAAVKMNVLHWHIIGVTSFPFMSKNRDHAIYGAYSSKKIYLNSDVSNVIQYAKLRGIKVLLELDNPGNIGEGWTWGSRKSYGDLNICHKNKLSKCENFCSQLNPNNKRSYKLLKDLLQEFYNMTGYSDVIHLGGSTNLQCWSSAEEIREMDVFKREGILGVLNYHQNEIRDILTNINGKHFPNIILWSDYFKYYSDQTNIDSRTYIAQVNGISEEEDERILINKGYRVIISHEDKWDLSRVWQWTIAYDHKPWEQLLWSQREQVLGGEAILFSNFTDENTLDARLWPVAAAIAEVLWSDPQVETRFNVVLRLQIFRDRLVDRGIKSAVVGPKWCVQNPGECV